MPSYDYSSSTSSSTATASSETTTSTTGWGNSDQQTANSESSGGLLDAAIDEVQSWFYDDNDVESNEQLAAQTASNLITAHSRVADLAAAAEIGGYSDQAALLNAIVEKYQPVADAAGDLNTALSTLETLEQVNAVLETSATLIAVDMSDSSAAAGAFDAWFAAVGTLGGAILSAAPGLGAVLAPYAEFMAELGGTGFFSSMVDATHSSCGRMEGIEGIEGDYGC